ncbi:MAG: hypothetical protein H2040_04390 [Euryhalocaulis sp.]|uniref:hypothetical protein n=1 Tax=Euryhalocaulis sp. TaxID=2744307 RepID=UPI00180CA640|nr:hypothetical protein [Euryhalocaulis sp.]MBA4801078.1 hypothetical protein [Euryhalocaulis sp.]
MSRDERAARQGEITLSVTLMTLAGALLGATFLSFVNVIKDVTGALVWVVFIAVGASLLLLLTSIIVGGRGIARGPKFKGWRGRFNIQAVCGLAGFILLVLGYALALLSARF